MTMPIDEYRERDPNAADAAAALTLWARLSAVVAFAVTVIWVATGRHLPFWPAWVWLGLAIPLVSAAAIRGALRAPAGTPRALAVHGTVWGLIITLDLVVWALTGMGYFWPAWPMLAAAVLLLGHGAIARTVGELPAEREQELVERVDELTRTRRGALDVQAAELRRIERDLHDGAQARLVALSMQLGRAEARLGDDHEVTELLRAARGEASAAIAELRDLARGIAPPVLADRGLAAAVEALGRRSAIEVHTEVRVPNRPPPVVETAAYFVVAEALTNVAKHGAGAAATATVEQSGDRLVIVVADDGPGGADPAGGGLSGLRQRVQALDGELTVTSPEGEGTTIRAELPCES
jgi:signal transduction histidine kinase